MAAKKKVTKTKEPRGDAKPKPVRKRAAPVEVVRQAAVVKRLLQKVEEQLGGEQGLKASLSDYIRLVQLQKEMDEETPKEIKVTWVESAVEPAGTESASEE